MRRRAAAAAAWTALAGTMLTACVTEVRMTPRTADWIVGGDRATWRSGDVAVEAALDVTDRRYPIRGEVRAGPAAQVAFVPQVSSEDGDLGEFRPPGEADARPSPIVANEFCPATAAADGTSALAFSLRPDVRWTQTPSVGSTVSYTIVVRTAGSEVRCPFLLRVDVARTRITALGAIGIGAGVVVLVAALFIGATGYFVATSFS